MPSIALLDLCCAWELFHAFLLAHDDIIDAARHRRDEPTLHHRLACLDSGSIKFGTDLAIVAGDLLFVVATKLLHELALDPAVHVRVMRLFSRVAATTGFGQAIDICQSHVPLSHVREATLLREYHWKTAAYTFEGPMLSGAIVAGADEAAQAATSRFALALGQAYQLQNDLEDLARPAAEGCDLLQGKRTITLIRARRAMSAPQRRAFDRKLESLPQANGHSLRLAEELRQELCATGALQETRRMVATLIETARSAAESPAVGGSLGDGLRDLLESVSAQYLVRV